jgi:hypothetical protein
LKDANEGKASEPKAGDASPIGSWQLRWLDDDDCVH